MHFGFICEAIEIIPWRFQGVMCDKLALVVVKSASKYWFSVYVCGLYAAPKMSFDDIHILLKHINVAIKVSTPIHCIQPTCMDKSLRENDQLIFPCTKLMTTYR